MSTEIKKGWEKVALIATMPKSGTWYNAYFFYFLHHLALKTETIPLPLSDEFVRTSHLLLRPSLNLDRFFICHTICPGYQNYLGDLKDRWNNLRFHNRGYIYGDIQTGHNPLIFDPKHNDNVRITYFYRNPLDQCLSAYRHSLKHVNEDNRHITTPFGGRIKISDPSEFLRMGGLESYIKQFLTFKLAAPHHPDKILMISYEDLTTDPKAALTKAIMHIFSGKLPSNISQEMVANAIRMSSAKNLRKIEKQFKRPLAGDQSDPNESHFRDGSIGSWKEFFSQDDVDFTEAKLAEFGLSLSQFQMEEDHTESTTKDIADSMNCA